MRKKPTNPDKRYGIKLSYEQLERYTNNFSEENLFCSFQFGRVYRGTIKRVRYSNLQVMVKIWEVSESDECSQADNEARLMLEFIMQQHECVNNHHGMIKMYGYCREKVYAIVYIFNPLNTLHNLVPTDGFNWVQRVKVALEFANHLKFLHNEKPPFMPFIVRNINANHFVLDEQFNMKLFDYSMITGGVLDDTTRSEDYNTYKCYDYIDPLIAGSGTWSKKTDVFAFGVILLNLMTKRINIEEEKVSGKWPIYKWAWDLYRPNNMDNESGNMSESEADSSVKEPVYSLVHPSLFTDHDFSFTDGRKITELAMSCINRNPNERPTMKRVFNDLRNLQVVKKNPKLVELGSELPSSV